MAIQCQICQFADLCFLILGVTDLPYQKGKCVCFSSQINLLLYQLHCMNMFIIKIPFATINSCIFQKPFCQPQQLFMKGIIIFDVFSVVTSTMFSLGLFKSSLQIRCYLIFLVTSVFVFPFQEFARFLRILGCYPMDTVVQNFNTSKVGATVNAIRFADGISSGNKERRHP